MSPTSGSSDAIAIDRLLTEAGHPAAMASSRPLNGAKLAVTGGNMGEIRVLDGDRDRRDAVARWLMQRDEIGMIFTASADPVDGAVPGTFSTALVGLDHARGADLVYVLRSSAEPDAHGLPGVGLITAGDVPVGGGMHGGLNRHELNTVLVLGGTAASNPSVTHAPAGIIDIAPTILDLLGLAAPVAMRGRSLLPADMRLWPAEVVAHEAGSGAFKQRLQVLRRQDLAFPLHGGRA